MHADSVFAEIQPGETISLLFDQGPSPHPSSVQEFVFSSRGYYVEAGGLHGARTRLTFSVPRAGRASLVVYDGRGRKIRELYDEVLPSGPPPIWWDGRDDDGLVLGPGVYFARFNSGSLRETVKLAIVR
jgi:hypothetical protein